MRALRSVPSLVLLLAGLGLAVGCGGAAEQAQSPPAETAASGATTVADAGSGAATAAEEEGEEDLFRQWGPDQMPDRELDPLQFWYWRVDQMFLNRDLDQDGKISPDEYHGTRFRQTDTNGDGYLTKREVVNYVVAFHMEAPVSSSE